MGRAPVRTIPAMRPGIQTIPKDRRESIAGTINFSTLYAGTIAVIRAL